jgi:hypothetical protein
MPFKKLKSIGKKVLKPVGKAVKKIVPKELAGIMQVAAPFTGPAAPFVYAAGAYKQSGRINPIVAATLALPYVGQVRGEGLGGLRYGRFDPSQLGGEIGQIRTARDLLGLRGAAEGTLRGKAEDFLFGEGQTTKPFEYESMVDGSTMTTDQIVPGTRGILGAEGAFDPIKGKLLTKKGGGLSPTKVATAVTMGLSLSQTQDQIEEEGQELGLADSEIAALQEEAAAMWQDFDTTAFRPKTTAAIGGLMRKNLAMGTVNPFKPKPEDYGVEDNELPADPKPFKPKPNVGNKAEITAEMMAQEYFGVSFNELTEAQKKGILELIGASKPEAQQGGLMRSNFALGTRPTVQESGLGGLPIEADMRYSGGFMPYGAKEKADDVPARLSKNEFVFTADAVRAAGGGSINKGAKRMYNTMKQLESMGRA